MVSTRLLALALALVPSVAVHAAGYQIRTVAEFPADVLVADGSVSINESGQVGFLVQRFAPTLVFDVYRGDAQVPAPRIAEGIDGSSAAGGSASSSIDAAGAVTVVGSVPPGGPSGILVVGAGPIAARVALSANLYNFGVHESNDAGQIVFLAGSPAGFTLQRREPNGDLSPLATAGFVPQHALLDLDGAGQLSFLATPDASPLGGTLFETTAGGLAPIADASGAFASFIDVARSEGGALVFQANLDGANAATTGSLYVGPDPVADRVFGVGDAFVGSTVSRLRLGDVNDAGEIAFFAELQDGRDLVLRADPAPEPEVALAGLAALAALASVCRRRARGVPFPRRMQAAA
jgi:MYXO-CTERM domain-containing protein